VLSERNLLDLIAFCIFAAKAYSISIIIESSDKLPQGFVTPLLLQLSSNLPKDISEYVVSLIILTFSSFVQ